jgi:hypothetical protein
MDIKDLPKIEQKKPEFQPKAAVSPADQWQEKAKKLVDTCHGALLQNKDQLARLGKRGISLESVKKHQLGWNEKELYRNRKAWGLPEKLRKGKPSPLWIPAGLVIPCIEKDIVYRVRIRRGPGDYQLLSGSRAMPRMLGAVTKGFVVVETELDGFMLFEKVGDLVGVLVLGAVAMKPTDVQYALLKKTVRILVALDFDGEPGGKASRWWIDNFPQVKRWPVSMGKDPGEALEKGLDIRAWILAGLPPAFKIKRTVSGCCAESFTEGGGAKEMPVPGSEKRVSSAPLGTHPDVKRLYELIEKAPVKIMAESGRLKVDIKAWFEKNNPEKCCEISALVFSSDVDAFLTEHPADIIDNGNFWEAAARK